MSIQLYNYDTGELATDTPEEQPTSGIKMFNYDELQDTTQPVVSGGEVIPMPQNTKPSFKTFSDLSTTGKIKFGLEKAVSNIYQGLQENVSGSIESVVGLKDVIAGATDKNSTSAKELATDTETDKKLKDIANIYSSGAASTKQDLYNKKVELGLNPDDEFSDSLLNGVGQVMGFMAGGVALKGASALLKLGKYAGTVLNAGNSFLESGMEANDTYKELKAQGKSDQEAFEGYRHSLATNAALIGITNKIGGVFEEKNFQGMKRFAKASFSGLMGGAQEYFQTIEGNFTQGKPLTQGASEAFLIGSILGVPTALVFDQPKKDGKQSEPSIEKIQEIIDNSEATPEQKEVAQKILDGTITEEEKTAAFIDTITNPEFGAIPSEENTDALKTDISELLDQGQDVLSITNALYEQGIKQSAVEEMIAEVIASKDSEALSNQVKEEGTTGTEQSQKEQGGTVQKETVINVEEEDGKTNTKTGESKTIRFWTSKSGKENIDVLKDGTWYETLDLNKSQEKYQTKDKETLANRIVNPHTDYNYQTEKYTNTPQNYQVSQTTKMVEEETRKANEEAVKLAESAKKIEALPRAKRMAFDEVSMLLGAAEAGKRVFIPEQDSSDLKVQAVSSTFPAWIPENMRSRKVFDQVIPYWEKQEVPPNKTPRVKALYEMLEKHSVEMEKQHQERIDKEMSMPDDGVEFKTKEVSNEANVLTDFKKRYKVDFPVVIVDKILHGKKDTLTKEAEGATDGNTIAIRFDSIVNTSKHELIHLTLAHLDQIPELASFSREDILKAQAEKMGIDFSENKSKDIEEQLALDFEAYQNKDYKPKNSILSKFFSAIDKMLKNFRNAIVKSNGDVIITYYDAVLYGESQRKYNVELETESKVSKYLIDNVLDYSPMYQTRRVLSLSNGITSIDFKSLENTNPLFEEAKKYKSGVPETVKIWNKSKFSNDGAYADIPVIRREDNITLYQGGSDGKRQFWTPDRKYAEKFGEVKSKTGSFYKVDNGNRVTDVYVEVPSSKVTTTLEQEAKNFKSAEEFVKAQPNQFKDSKIQETLYHGTHEDFKGFDSNFDYENIPDNIGQIRDYEVPQGVVFLSDSIERTKSYGGKTIPVDVKAKKVLVVDAGGKSPDRFFDDDYNGSQKIWGKFESGGYDAIKITGETPRNGKTSTYITYPENLKDKSQLTDIWKQANSIGVSFKSKRPAIKEVTGLDQIRINYFASHMDGEDVKVLEDYLKVYDENQEIKPKKGELISKEEEKAIEYFNEGLKLYDTKPEQMASISAAILEQYYATTPKVNVWNEQPKFKEAVNRTVDMYKESGDLTTKILKDLEGKSTVSKQFILDATNRGELKQVERDLVRKLVEGEGNTVDVTKFANKVKAELLPLERKAVGEGKNLSKYESISLPDDLRGNVKNYTENIYASPIKTSAGNVHFGGSKAGENYFGHTRIEDMADNQTRRVIEVQSDLYQKGNLEKELTNDSFDYTDKKTGITPKYSDRMATRAKEASKLSQYNDPTAHFRMIREEIKKAAEDGKTKLQFPTGETAMKIEGLGSVNQWGDRELSNRLVDENPSIGLSRLQREARLTPANLKVGKEVNDGGNDWIITDVLGDGKFKAVPKSRYETKTSEFMNEKELAEMKDAYTEEFDISGKVDTNNPIYKFYEKEVAKYLKNNYKAETVTDDKGVTWYEVKLKDEYKGAVVAFKERVSRKENEEYIKKMYPKYYAMTRAKQAQIIEREKKYGTRSVSQRLEDKTKALGISVEDNYEIKNFISEVAKSENILKDNQDKIADILNGKYPYPTEVSKTAFLHTVIEELKAKNDTKLLTKAYNQLAEEGTVSGQNIAFINSIYKTYDETSPETYLNKIKAERETMAFRKDWKLTNPFAIKEKKAERVKKIKERQTSIKSAVKDKTTIKIKELDSILDSFMC